MKCMQENCPGRVKTFYHLSIFERHMQNYHINPLMCTEPGCTHRKPFGRKGDLNRHFSSVHKGERPFKCPVKGCRENTHGFTRRYKLQQHRAEKHHLFRCTLTHCSAKVQEGSEHEHLAKDHGEFECALGACQARGESQFKTSSLNAHLELEHGLWPKGLISFSFGSIMKAWGTTTVLPGNIRFLLDLLTDREVHVGSTSAGPSDNVFQIRDCSVCSQSSAKE